jgi:hypothetical protein
MRSIADQSVDEMGGRGSVLTRQKRDHIELDRLLKRLDVVPEERQDEVLLDIYRLVFPHAFAEESVLWPVMRRVLPDGEELTLRVELEHQRINELVGRLEALPPGSPERRALLDEVVPLLQADVRDEEDLLLPRLQERLSKGKLRRLGWAWDAVRRVAPTRAHPVVSRRPPGNVLAALPLSVLDRSRDFIDARRHRRPDAAGLTRASDVLARAAHAVERWPGMRSGENRATRIGRGRIGWGAVLAFAAGTATVTLLRRRKSSAAAALS